MSGNRGAQEDRASVAGVLAGDTAAFAGIVQRWQGPLINLAWRFCRDRGRAEEMAQEAFLRAYRNLAQWRGCVFHLAVCACGECLPVRAASIPAAMLSLDEIVEPADPRVSGRALEEAEQADAIRRAVTALPEKYKEAILLYYFHEQDVTAAARTLAVPEGTVKARLFRGRELLRKKFASRSGASETTKGAARFLEKTR